MTKGRHVLIPSELGTRLRTLFQLNNTPQTLGQLGILAGQHMETCLAEQGMSTYFEAVSRGDEIFGAVEYDTPHKVNLSDGREVFVACALDALIEGLFQPVVINSGCLHCGESIRITMQGGTVSSVVPSKVAMWLGMSREGSGSCCTNLCPYINFFSSNRHAEEWRTKNPEELGILLTLPQSVQLAREGYWNPVHRVPPISYLKS